MYLGKRAVYGYWSGSYGVRCDARMHNYNTCFGFRISGFGFRVSGFGFRVSSFGFRVSGFGLRVSGFGFRVSNFQGPGFWVSGFGIRVSGLGFRVQGGWVDLGRLDPLFVNETQRVIDTRLCRANRDQLKRFHCLLPARHGLNLAVTVLLVPYSLGIGTPYM